MLGRLRMTAEECKKAYIKLLRRIFQRKHTRPLSRERDLWPAKGQFESKELEKAIKETINEISSRADEEMFKDPDPLCKVYVIPILAVICIILQS
jgi:hypothetical protein